MKVTVVCDVLGPENNGTTIAAMNFIRYLQDKNHEVKVLCADQNKIGLDNYYIVPNLNVGPLNGLLRKNGVTLANPKNKTIREAIQGSDIIHIMLPFLLGHRTMKMAKKLNIPMTSGCHMQAENFSCQFKMQDKTWFNNLIYKIIYNRTYKYMDAIHYPTQFMRDCLENAVGKKTNGYIISNGVNNFIKKINIDKPSYLKNKYVIISIGRYSREKAQDVLINAIKLSKHKDNIQLILAGHGPIENDLKILSKDLPVAPIFKFYQREEINNLINYADIYVHPAEMELEGIACIEAISCGKMTIVSDSKKSATRNFAIDDSCRFKSRDSKDLADKIDYWLEHETERKEYEKKYLNSSISYNQDECMSKMENMLYEVIDAHKKKTTK